MIDEQNMVNRDCYKQALWHNKKHIKRVAIDWQKCDVTNYPYDIIVNAQNKNTYFGPKKNHEKYKTKKNCKSEM